MSARNLRPILSGLVALGLFFAVGCKKQAPISLACNATPPAVYQGEPVSATAAASSVSTSKNNSLLYSWSGTGVTGNGDSANIATDALNPGSYTVNAEVKEGKKGKEGRKPGQTAQCSASFTVKEFEPPTVSCKADPPIIKPGEKSTITCAGVSPQKRPLNFRYESTAGSISGVGSEATFSSEGAPTGLVGITCEVQDDKSHSAKGETSVTILAPPVPPAPHVQELCGVSFARDTKRPTRVDNEAKACLDQVALDLKRYSDANLVIAANSNTKEELLVAKQEKLASTRKHAKVLHFDQQRAMNMKDYLVSEQGIDATRISVTTGSGDDQNAQNYLVPAGASFAADVHGTTPIDETNLRPELRKPLPVRHHGKAIASWK